MPILPQQPKNHETGMNCSETRNDRRIEDKFYVPLISLVDLSGCIRLYL
jgi:hypothetical protein